MGNIDAKRSMAEDFPALMPDISELEWANEAFGGPPEATNLWIGGDQSVTSFHKDCIKAVSSLALCAAVSQHLCMPVMLNAQRCTPGSSAAFEHQCACFSQVPGRLHGRRASAL